MWLLTVFLCGLGAAQHLDSQHDNSIIEKGIIVSDEIQEYGLKTFNATCNNLLAAQECADTCDDRLWDCLNNCTDQGELSDSECLHECGRQEYGCVDKCPCYTQCPHGCPCEHYECEPRSCEEQYYDEAVECVSNCIPHQNACIAKCDAFDVLCFETCQKKFNTCIANCPCNFENDGSAQSRTLILYGGMARIFTWFSDNNEQIQTLTPLGGNQYFDFGTHRVGEGCMAFYKGQHWFLGGRYNADGVAYLEREDCAIKDAGFVLPDSMSEHTCTVYHDEIWMCGAQENPNRCYTFNGGGFLRKSDTSYPHSYGTMQAAKAFGMVIVGGANSGSSTELSVDGYRWVAGPGYPYMSNVGPSSVEIDGFVYVFGGTVAKTQGYKLIITENSPETCWDNALHEGCDLIWKNIGQLLTNRHYHRTIHQPSHNTVLHIGGEGGTEYLEKWRFNGTDYETVLARKNSAYSINYNRPEAYSIEKDYCFPTVGFEEDGW